MRRLRTGRPPKKIDDDIYALYLVGARQELDGARVEALFLTTDEARPVTMKEPVIRNRLQKYDDAIAGIRAGRFAAKPNDPDMPALPAILHLLSRSSPRSRRLIRAFPVFRSRVDF